MHNRPPSICLFCLCLHCRLPPPPRRGCCSGGICGYIEADTVAPLLVHRARVRIALARRREVGAAGVHALALLALSHHDSSAAAQHRRELSGFVKDRYAYAYAYAYSGLAVNESERSDGPAFSFSFSFIPLCSAINTPFYVQRKTTLAVSLSLRIRFNSHLSALSQLSEYVCCV